jgi:SAM-dependent methyltransferase
MAEVEIPSEIADEIRQRVFEKPGLMKVTQVLRKNGQFFRISLRPVQIREEKMWQGEMVDEGKTKVKNFDLEGAKAGLEEMINQTGPREMHLVTASGDLHVRVTRKGRVLVSRSAKLQRAVEDALGNDRVKRLPLTAFHATPLLKAIGIADGDGRIKVSMRGKYDQVNAFLQEIDTVLSGREEKKTNLVDCGCGRAYLTLAAQAYLTQVRGFEVKVCGIDRRHDVITIARKLAEDLDVTKDVSFIEGDIDKGEPSFKPDLVLSLHACDTATDEAIARGIEWGSQTLLCVPCCQHELHKSIKDGGPMQGVLRHGILRERLADLLTDTFRAQILRILGYKVQVVEFVSSEATARNILLKAELGVKPGQSTAVSEYLELRDFWHVTPWLETRMGERLSKLLAAREN